MITVKNETYLTVPETSTMTGRAKQTIYQQWREWGWSGYDFGGRLMFKQSDIQSWLDLAVVPK